jgi:hypothetical protein
MVFDSFLAYIRATFDMTGGVFKLALQVFKDDLDRWEAEREYFGHPASREFLAQETVSVWRWFSQLVKATGQEYNESLCKPLWRQAGIEATRELYGREMSAADYDLDQRMWAQLRKDMAIGLPASESEASCYGLLTAYCTNPPAVGLVLDYRRSSGYDGRVVSRTSSTEPPIVKW